jgi:uncharacterized membrane protein
MTLTPLLTASPFIQLHVICALLAVALGPMALLRRSRDIWHRRLGRAWVAAMVGTALSSFLIKEGQLIGPFSLIHLLSILTLWGLWDGVLHARAGRIAEHRTAMLSLYIYAIGIAGLFTLLPGRRMSQTLFPAAPWTGFWICAALLVLAITAVQLRTAKGGIRMPRH